MSLLTPNFRMKCSHTCLLLLLTISFNCLIHLSTSSIMYNAIESDIYADCGRDQPVVINLLDAEEKLDRNAFMQEYPKVLKLLEEHPDKKSAYIFLSYLVYRYNMKQRCTMNNDVHSSLVPENLITGFNEYAIQQSKVIRSFESKDVGNDLSQENRHHLAFNVSGDQNYLAMATLRIYKHPSKGKWSKTDKELTILVSSIVKTHVDGPEFEVLTSGNINADYEGWLELNVTKAFSFWLEDQTGFKTIYIEAYDVEENEKIAKISDVGFVSQKHDSEYRPFLVGYFNGPEINLIELLMRSHRLKRSTGSKSSISLIRSSNKVPFEFFG